MKSKWVLPTALLFAFAIIAPVYAQQADNDGPGAIETKRGPAKSEEKHKGISIWLIVGGVVVVGVVAAVLLTKKSKDEGEEQQKGVILEQDVQVGGGGGYANVSFHLSAPANVRIVLSGENPSMEPYGSLDFPDGRSIYFPPNGGSVNGQNMGEVNLDKAGNYTLTIFDGANRGGRVHVKIEVL